MRLPALLAACILVIPAYTTAQTAAADGVLALIHDDPSAAIRILGPLVEGRAEPDPLAAFFLALAYQFGGRGPSDPMRSCGLLMKAATPSNPLMRQAELLARQLHMNSGLARNQCEIAATRGWGEPAWTTFTLSPGHRVRIDRDGFSVEHQGATKLTPGGWGGGGWQFLPIRLNPSRNPAARSVATVTPSSSSSGLRIRPSTRRNGAFSGLRTRWSAPTLSACPAMAESPPRSVRRRRLRSRSTNLLACWLPPTGMSNGSSSAPRPGGFRFRRGAFNKRPWCSALARGS